jgi:hypothetical protein
LLSFFVVFSHGNGYTLHVLSADCEMDTLSTSVLVLAWKGIHYARPDCWLRKWIHPARPYCYSGGKGYSTPCTSILLVVEIDTPCTPILLVLVVVKGIPMQCTYKLFLKGGFFGFGKIFYVRYSSLLSLPPLRSTVSEDVGIEPRITCTCDTWRVVSSPPSVGG